MTAAEFRQRRLSERWNRELKPAAFGQPGWDDTRRVMQDFGRGDMFGGGDVWSPPTTGYRIDANRMESRRFRKLGAGAGRRDWREFSRGY